MSSGTAIDLEIASNALDKDVNNKVWFKPNCCDHHSHLSVIALIMHFLHREQDYCKLLIGQCNRTLTQSIKYITRLQDACTHHSALTFFIAVK